MFNFWCECFAGCVAAWNAPAPASAAVCPSQHALYSLNYRCDTHILLGYCNVSLPPKTVSIFMLLGASGRRTLWDSWGCSSCPFGNGTRSCNKVAITTSITHLPRYMQNSQQRPSSCEDLWKFTFWFGFESMAIKLGQWPANIIGLREETGRVSNQIEFMMKYETLVGEKLRK